MLCSWSLAICRPRSFDNNGLNRTRRSGAQDGVTLRFVGGWIVPQRFLTMQVEGARR
jgi:hypothetical protein